MVTRIRAASNVTPGPHVEPSLAWKADRSNDVATRCQEWNRDIVVVNDCEKLRECLIDSFEQKLSQQFGRGGIKGLVRKVEWVRLISFHTAGNYVKQILA